MTLWQSEIFTNKYGNNSIQNLSQRLEYQVAQQRILLKRIKAWFEKNISLLNTFCFWCYSSPPNDNLTIKNLH
jgi:hypothetical protein